MNGTLSFDWLPQQAIWAHSARSRFPALVAQEKVAILTSRGVASFSTSIMDKSPWDSTALFIFFCHFSVLAVLPPPTLYKVETRKKKSGYTRPTLFAE